MANLDPWGMVGRIYKGDYLTLLHAKYKSSRPHGFRKKYFYFLPIVSLWELMTPPGVANLDPMGMIGKIYVG